MRLALAGLLIAALASCSGSSSGGSAQAQSKAKTSYPKCSTVWVVGKTLPRGYQNCIGSDGSVVLGAEYDCKDGSHLTTHDKPDSFALEGGVIVARTDAALGAAITKCDPK